MKKKIILITTLISTIILTGCSSDNIKDKKAFFACSRFIHALEIMNKFNRDLYIMDADMMMIDSPYEFLKNQKNMIWFVRQLVDLIIFHHGKNLV